MKTLEQEAASGFIIFDKNAVDLVTAFIYRSEAESKSEPIAERIVNNVTMKEAERLISLYPQTCVWES